MARIGASFCCTGTGIETTARYNEGIYVQQENSLYINLYVPLELIWKETGMKGDSTCGEDLRFSRIAALLSDFDAPG